MLVNNICSTRRSLLATARFNVTTAGVSELCFPKRATFCSLESRRDDITGSKQKNEKKLEKYIQKGKYE